MADIVFIPPASGVYVIKNPNLPEYRFEWHAFTRKVYAIDLAEKVLIGEVIGEHVNDHGQAIGVVQTWCRGYYVGQRKSSKNDSGLLRKD